MQKHLKKGRVVLALLFFITILISFTDAKGKMPGAFYTAVIYLQFIPSVLKTLTPGAVLSIGFLFVLLLTILGGRVYCSTICPLGVLQDIMIFLRRKINPNRRFKFKKALNILRYSFLGGTIISFTFLGILLLNFLDPYAVFGRIGSHIYQPVILFINNTLASILPSFGFNTLEQSPVHIASLFFGTGMLLLVFVMSFLGERLYCNSVCPVGTLLGFVSKFSFFKINIAPSSCTKCGKCQAACKSNCINIKTLEIDESRCVSCYNCIPVCSDGAIGYKRSRIASPKSNDKGDSRRRFFIAASASYLASKAVPAFARQQNDEEEHVCFFSKGPTAPPGAMSIDHLKDRCVACHLCVSVCPTNVLQPSFLEYGFTGMNLPEMNYGVNFCNFDCTKCGEVCPTGAIIKLPVDEKHLTQIGKVVLRIKKCIVETKNKACGSCSEHCPTQAVKMVPYHNGLPAPKIDTTICIGCGACEYACPVTEPHPAIFVAPNEVHVLAEKPVEDKVEFDDSEEFPF
jgi:ferredoxin